MEKGIQPDNSTVPTSPDNDSSKGSRSQISTQKTIRIDGAELSLEQSLPQITEMLQSVVPKQRRRGLNYLQRWGVQLRGTDEVELVVEMYGSEQDAELRTTIVKHLP